MSAISREEWLQYAEEWGSEHEVGTNGVAGVCLCFVRVHVCFASPIKRRLWIFQTAFVEMTELLAHLDVWALSSCRFGASGALLRANSKEKKQKPQRLDVAKSIENRAATLP